MSEEKDLSKIKDTMVDNLNTKPIGEDSPNPGEALGKIGRTIGYDVKGIVEKVKHAFEPDSIDIGSVFITCATDAIGHRAAVSMLDLLAAKCPTVKVGVRNKTATKDLTEKGVEVAKFSWESEDTYEEALKDVKTVLCIAPYMQDWQVHFPPFLEACMKAGVQHFIKLSFYHARVSGDPFQQVPLVALHGNCDELLAESEIPYTILSASHFMSNIMVFQAKNIMRNQKPAVFYGSSHDHGVNYVSPNDVAEAAVRIILDPNQHLGKEYTLTGPEAIKDQSVASILSDHFSKPIMYVDQPVGTFKTQFDDKKWCVDDLVSLEKVKAMGTEESPQFISSDITVLCGHEPESFDEYLEHRSYMTPKELGASAA